MTHIRIYYYTDDVCKNEEDLLNIILRGEVNGNTFIKYYVEVYSLNEEILTSIESFLDMIFSRFNDESNPLSTKECQEKIKEKNSHTSMTVGDIIKIDNEYYIVASMGFKKLSM